MVAARSIRSALATLTGGGDLGGVLRAAGWVLAIRVIATGLGYATMVALARWMGADELGIYTYAWACVTLLTLVAGLGLSSVCVRYVSEYLAAADLTRLKGLLSRSLALALTSSSAMSVLAMATVYAFKDRLAPEYVGPLLFAFAGLPVVTLATLLSQIGRGLGSMVVGYAPSQILFPLLVLSAAAVLHATSGPIAAVTLVPLSLVLYFVAASAQMTVYAGRLGPLLRGVAPSYETRTWLRMGLPLVMFEGFFGLVAYTDLLMLGVFNAPSEIAYYNAAIRISMLVNFLADAISALAGPKVAELNARRETATLQSLLRDLLPWLLPPTAAVALGVVVLGRFLLGLFGPGFDGAYPALLVLATGGFLAVCVGPAPLVLSMTGRQDDCARVLGVTAAVNALLNLALIPWLGLPGAALATATSRLVANVWLRRLTVRYLAVDPSVLALLRR